MLRAKRQLRETTSRSVAEKAHSEKQQVIWFKNIAYSVSRRYWKAGVFEE